MTEQPQLLERVVIGPKSYSWYDHEAKEGEKPRKVAKPGALIKVTAAQANAFPHRLQDPRVAEANAEAARVTREAQEEADKIAAEASTVVAGVVEPENDDDAEEDED